MHSMDGWRTAIVQSDATHIWLRGYDVTSLMQQCTFASIVFLLQQGRLPDPREQRLLDAILIAVSDHGAGAPSCAASRLVASGNRGSLSAAIAAGVLAIGDEHGGAGEACMEIIAAVVERARRDGLTIVEAATRQVDESRAAGRRLPGFGHRVHTTDPRVEVLFRMAEETGLAKDGVAAVRAIEVALRERVKPLPLSIDGALAAVLFDLGFPSNAGKLMFIIGRVAGLAAEVAEEHVREKAMRIRIPVEYDGVPPRQID
jgi:citrate synthase